MARSILSYAYNYNFCDCLALNDSSYYKSSHGSKWNSLNNTYGPVVKVEPNPADTWVAFNYEFSSKESVGYLKISSISGEQVQHFVLHGKKGQQIWDTRTVDPGVYLYTLISNGLKSTGKIVIK
ncbi:MAG: T9SS type A sorting domain-containing protein [Bacteroidales bacterium]|nr:T9SS type A sorting domain-containing protein [Bacteroidales bacterium]MCF8350625.1 T9SS type A sorting domain-containing protein [Bacteroidales bacterium]